MDNLNKQQLILLAVLVSFVTSIATGITTVSLLVDQSSPTVSQTINRVVEKTIEKVTPVEVPKETPKPVTVVVTQEDQTVKAVDKNAKSIVRITGFTPSGQEVFLGLGVVVNKDGAVLTNKDSVPTNYTIYGTYANNKYPLSIAATDDKEGLMLLKLNKSATDTSTFSPIQFANSDNVKLGQTAVAVSGQDKNIVSIGIVSGIGQAEQDPNSTTKPSVYSVDTTISLSNIIAGSPIINLSGDILGIKIGDGTGQDVFKASNILKKFVTSQP